MRLSSVMVLALTIGSVASPLLFQATQVRADGGTAGLSATRVNIGFSGPVPSNVDARIDSAGGILLSVVPDLHLVVAQNKTSTTQFDFISAMKAYSDTLYATPDASAILDLVPNDPQYTQYQQIGLAPTHVEAAWDTTLGSPGVLVGAR